MIPRGAKNQVNPLSKKNVRNKNGLSSRDKLFTFAPLFDYNEVCMSAPKKEKRSFLGRLWRVLLKLVALFLIVSVFSTILFRWMNPPFTPLMVIRMIDQKASGSEVKMQYHWVDIDSISPNMPRAVIAGEDSYFLYHSGFDWDAISKAKEYNKTHKIKRGASTVSQQTAKNVFLWPDRTWVRKGLEVYFTFLIETFWSKERIMEVYLNVIEYGDGIYGVERASQEYFKKPANKLSMDQAALLVASLPNPRKWNVKKSPSVLYKRKAIILRNMNILGPQKLVKHPYSERPARDSNKY